MTDWEQERALPVCCSLRGLSVLLSRGHWGWVKARQCNGGGAFGPSALLGLPLAPPDHCAPGMVTGDHSLHVGMMFAPQNSAISPPSWPSAWP